MKQSNEYYRGKAILAFGHNIMKYAPVVVALITMLYCAVLVHGYRFPFMDTIFSTSLYGLIIYTSASYAFGFCHLHRAFILYDFLLSFCFDFQTKEGYTFGTWLEPLHWITFSAGIILFAILIKRGIRVKQTNQ